MTDKRLHEGKGTKELPARPYVQVPSYEKLFQPHGAYDGKMFHSAGKVTYTFIDKKEVVSLHFDRQRKRIFYKGHNVDNLDLNQARVQHLEKFGSQMQKRPATRSYAGAYLKLLQSILKKRKSL